MPVGTLVPSVEPVVDLLAEIERPRRLRDIVGQQAVKKFLVAAIQDERIPPGLMCYGPPGVGKTSFAKVFAALLNCVRPTGQDACGECVQCVSVQLERHPAVISLHAGQFGLIENARWVTQNLMYTATGQRVVLIDEAHALSPEAGDVLLKALEETKHQTVLVLTTTRPVEVAPTLRQRCFELEFRPVELSDIHELLLSVAARHRIAATDDLLQEITRRSAGSPRAAVMELDRVSRLRIEDVAAFREQFGELGGAIDVLRAIISGEEDRARALVTDTFERQGSIAALVDDLDRVLADVASIASGGRSASRSRDERSLHATLAAEVEAGVLDHWLDILWHDGPRLRDPGRMSLAVLQMSKRLVEPRADIDLLPDDPAEHRRDARPIDEGDAWTAKTCARPRRAWKSRQYLRKGLEVTEDRCGTCASCRYNTIRACALVVEASGANAVATLRMSPTPSRETLRDRMKKIRHAAQLEWAWYAIEEGSEVRVLAALRTEAAAEHAELERLRAAADRPGVALLDASSTPPTGVGALFLDHLLRVGKQPLAEAREVLDAHFALTKGSSVFTSDHFVLWNGKPATLRPAIHQALRSVIRKS